MLVCLNRHVDNGTTISPPHSFSMTNYVPGKCLCSHLLKCPYLMSYSFTCFECNPKHTSSVFMYYNVDNFLTGVTSNAMTSKSSRLEVFFKKGVLRNFTKFTGKHLCQSLFFNKVAGLRPEQNSKNF